MLSGTSARRALEISAFLKDVFTCLATISTLPAVFADFGIIVAIRTHHQSVSVEVDQPPDASRKAFHSAIKGANLVFHIHPEIVLRC